jgi:hypothetical protein
MRGENLDSATLVELRLARFIPFHHILRISMISNNKINAANLLQSIQNNLLQVFTTCPVYLWWRNKVAFRKQQLAIILEHPSITDLWNTDTIKLVKICIL